MSSNNRFSYQVVQVKPQFFGIKPQTIQDELNRLGAQGWELVNAVQTHSLHGVMLYLKKAL